MSDLTTQLKINANAQTLQGADAQNNGETREHSSQSTAEARGFDQQVHTLFLRESSYAFGIRFSEGSNANSGNYKLAKRYFQAAKYLGHDKAEDKLRLLRNITRNYKKDFVCPRNSI